MNNRYEREYLEQFFPLLKNDPNFLITSECTDSYNCIAWATGNDGLWYWPLLGNDAPEDDEYWPKGVADNTQIESFVAALKTNGFSPCADGSMEAGFVKIALYVKDGEATHACRQLDNGLWTSKMGPLNDIQHSSPFVLEGNFYGNVSCFMKKSLS